MDAKVVAETPRLVLTTWAAGDIELLASLGDGEVVRYLGGPPWTTSTARESIELYQQIEARLGITTWAVRLRDTGQLIGTCGFAGTNVPWLRSEFVIEIGWTLGRPWWGQGLATEAGHAAVGLAIARYPSERIISKCNIHNIASERVMHRIGMRRVGVVQGSWPDPTVLCRFP